MKLSSQLVLAAVSAGSLFAHWPWLEPARDGSPARAYFGVFPSEKMTGNRVQAMASARFWSYTAGQGYQAAKPAVGADALDLGLVDGGVMDYNFGVYAGHGPATLVLFSAKAFRRQVPAQAAVALPLELVAMGDLTLRAGQAGRMRLLRNGQPLAGQTIHLYTDTQGERHLAKLKAKKESAKHDHAHDQAHDHAAQGKRSEESGEIPTDALRFTTDGKGEFALTLPAAGRYQFHVSVREATPGTHEGKAYQSVTLMSTLCVDIE